MGALLKTAAITWSPDTTALFARLVPQFAKQATVATATSALRTPEHQLAEIRVLLKQTGLDKRFPEAMTCGLDEKDADGHYLWQLAWSTLLTDGRRIVNPCYDCECLTHYVRPNGEDMFGKVMPQTPHAHGNALDLSGSDLDAIVRAVEFAKLQDAWLKDNIAQIKVEPGQRCVHITVKPDCGKTAAI